MQESKASRVFSALTRYVASIPRRLRARRHYSGPRHQAKQASFYPRRIQKFKPPSRGRIIRVRFEIEQYAIFFNLITRLVYRQRVQKARLGYPVTKTAPDFAFAFMIHRLVSLKPSPSCAAPY
jgi:hypothetical protein